MYPSYKLEDVLDMYASAFFVLLEEGYRLKYRNYRMMATIGALPHMENDSDRQAVLDNLDMAGQDPRDILISEKHNDYSGIETLKGLME